MHCSPLVSNRHLCKAFPPKRLLSPQISEVYSLIFGETTAEKSGILWTWEGLSELHWVWCNGKGSHLELRQEPKGSSPFQTPTTGSLKSWDRRVRPRLVWRNGTPLASRVVHRITDHLSSCEWNLRFFP